MIFDRMSRRFFLRGAGAGLILPFLPSVMPSRAYGMTAIRRYVQIISPFGQFGRHFYPGDQGLALQGSTGVHAKSLPAMREVSKIVGPAFNSLKSKFSLVRGCNVLAGSGLHNGSYPTCAAGTYTDNVGNGPSVRHTTPRRSSRNSRSSVNRPSSRPKIRRRFVRAT